LDDADDIRLYDEVKSKNEPRISFDDYMKQGSKKNMANYKIIL